MVERDWLCGSRLHLTGRGTMVFWLIDPTHQQALSAYSVASRCLLFSFGHFDPHCRIPLTNDINYRLSSCSPCQNSVSFPAHPPVTSHTHGLLSPYGQESWSSLSLIQGQWAPYPLLLEGKKVQQTVSLSYLASWLPAYHHDSGEQCLEKPVTIYTRLSTLHPTWNSPNGCFKHNYQTLCNPDNSWMAGELACS